MFKFNIYIVLRYHPVSSTAERIKGTFIFPLLLWVRRGCDSLGLIKCYVYVVILGGGLRIGGLPLGHLRTVDLLRCGSLTQLLSG